MNKKLLTKVLNICSTIKEAKEFKEALLINLDRVYFIVANSKAKEVLLISLDRAYFIVANNKAREASLTSLSNKLLSKVSSIYCIIKEVNKAAWLTRLDKDCFIMVANSKAKGALLTSLDRTSSTER